MWGGGGGKNFTWFGIKSKDKESCDVFYFIFEGGPQTDGSFLWGAIWFGAIFAPHRWVVLQKLPSLCSHLWGILAGRRLIRPSPSQIIKAQSEEGVGVEGTPQHPGIWEQLSPGEAGGGDTS